MIVLVTGGRAYDRRDVVYGTLDALHEREPITYVIHGACEDRQGRLCGADRLADEWARSAGVQPVRCPALWDRYGRAAGPIRNSAMLNLVRPACFVAFPGGSGTANMVRKLRDAGVAEFETKNPAQGGV